MGRMIPSERKYKADRVAALAKAINEAINGDGPTNETADDLILYCDELKRRLSQKKKRG